MADDETRKDWDRVQENQTDVTERLRVKGGYLYRVITKANGGVALVFVAGE
jgi:hypothetical protein